MKTEQKEIFQIIKKIFKRNKEKEIRNINDLNGRKIKIKNINDLNGRKIEMILEWSKYNVWFDTCFVRKLANQTYELTHRQEDALSSIIEKCDIDYENIKQLRKLIRRERIIDLLKDIGD